MSYENSADHIGKIAAKLFNDGLDAETYNKAKAIEILNRTVAPVWCKKVLEAHETEIIEEMKTFTRTF